LKTYCEQLKRHLQQLPEVSLIDIRGFSDRQFRVSLSAEALRRHGLSAADVAAVITRQNIDLPAGIVETDLRDLVIRFTNQRITSPEIADLVITGRSGGAEIRVRDLGTVQESFELEEDKILLNGRRAGALAIQKTKKQDTIRVADAVKSLVAEESIRQPQVEIVISRDLSTLVQDRLSLLVKNGWQGAILVFATMWLFFNLRLSFWVVMSLPVSFLGAFFIVPYFDLTINMLTMVGLLLAVGILMDDGIVIAENIAAHRAAGKSPVAAAVDGTKEVAGGVISSFLTTACVLGPLAALEGDIGKVLRVVPMILLLVLVVSLIEAFCILPAHLAHSLEHAADKPGSNKLRMWLDRAVEWLRERLFGRAIDGLVRWRYLWVGVVVMLFLSTIGLVAGGVVQFKAFPELDGDVIESRVLLPPGTPLLQTEPVVARIAQGLRTVNQQFKGRQPQQQDLVKHVYVEFNKNADAFETGPHVATIVAWRDAVGPIPGAMKVTYTEPSIGPAGRNIEVRLKGEDLDELEKAAAAMEAYLEQFAGVYNLTSDLRRGPPEMRVRLREGAVGVGLDALTIGRQLRAAFQGITADEIQIGSELYEIDVQLEARDQNSYADLANFHCTLPNGESIPLDAVATVTQDRGWSRITRVSGLRTVTLRGDTDSAQTNTNQLLKRLKTEFVPQLAEQSGGVSVDFEGETKEAETTQQSMIRGALIGLIGVFVLLSFQFKSYFEPLLVMAAIPLALVGVVIGHLIMGLDLTMPSTLGFVSLSGIVVNDSILLVLFLKSKRSAGQDPTAAAGAASRARFRAILLTSLTTMAGLLPLTLERSLQAQVLIPLAVSIIFGLFASTVLVLSVIPCLYLILDDFRLTGRIEPAEKQEA
jgi:multidrug efflux pump subunit AcrB